MKHVLSHLKVLHGEPNYITVEDTGQKQFTADQLNATVAHLINQCRRERVKRLNVSLSNQSPNIETFRRMLEAYDFQQKAQTILVKKDLNSVEDVQTPYVFKPLGTVSELTFKRLWKRSMYDSKNSGSSLSIDDQLASLKVELGQGYAKSCIAVYEGDQGIGVVMPHLEPGTQDEGRLFYFGLVPEARGKGKSVVLHQKAMYLLKKMGASHYVGSTEKQNDPMLAVFRKNECPFFEENFHYQLELAD